MITVDEYLYYVKKALDSMVSILRGLGDDLSNRKAELEGANSPYVILNHCLGVADFWSGQIIAGGTIERDREAEFAATGSVEELAARTEEVFSRLEAVARAADYAAPVRGEVNPNLAGSPIVQSQGAALLHIYEEISQHLGQMEGARDILSAA